MKQHVLAWARWAFLAVCMVPLGTLQAVFTWNGPVASGTYANDTINITGNCTLAAPGQRVEILASTQDVHVTVTAGDVTVGVNDAVGSPVALDLVANAGFTIYFDLTDSLVFQGGAEPLLITCTGNGNVVFTIAGGKEIGFSNGLGGMGTYFLISMSTIFNTPNTFAVAFRRQAIGDTDSIIQIDGGSFVGFVGTDLSFATEFASIAFDATNALGNTGRLKLDIEDRGSFSIQGHLNNHPALPYNLTDIDFTQLAGNNASVALTTDNSGWAGFLVLNNNMTMPALRANPWVQIINVVEEQPGFVMGMNGSMFLNDGTYLDYVGGSINISPTPTIPFGILDQFAVNGVVPPVNTLVKERNPSAFIVDSGSNIYATLPYSRIQMVGHSKMYFTSGVASESGLQNRAPLNPDFTVDPKKQFSREAGYGSIVFDVEGRLDIQGDPEGATAINILSLKEAVTGGSVLIEGTETNFKLRTYELDVDGVLKQYGKACFMVNGRMNLYSTNLQHTDAIHQVFERNIPQESEPCYIGGDSMHLVQSTQRPTIAYYNSNFLVHSSVAFSGVDTLVPSNGAGLGAQANFSNFAFYYNGYAVDQGTGRSWIAGSDVGGTAVDFGTIVDRDAHFNSWQEFDHPVQSIVATMTTSPNNNKVVQAIVTDVTGQYSNHTFFLAHGSNISLGVDAAQGTDPITLLPFTLTSVGTLRDSGDFIDYETQGGLLNQPDTSIETGQGGIFVDNFGFFGVTGTKRAFIGCMVGVGPYTNSTVRLPAYQVYFDNLVGIANSRLDLTDPNQRTVIANGTEVQAFSLDWKYVKRDYSIFTPYVQSDLPSAGLLPAPIQANVTGLPRVEGEVGQFQIFNSRLGDPATLDINGGDIRELILLTEDVSSGDAPVGTLVLRNNAEVGLGEYDTTPDRRLVLGTNGVTLMPDGPAEVFLNQDILINNVCHIVAGPNFGTQEVQQLIITSQVPREIRIRSGGVLDLSLFNTPNKQLVIAGQVRVVFEPNSMLILGGGELIVSDTASISFQRYLIDSPTGTSLTSTDDRRVRICGTGTIRMQETSFAELPRDAYVGIESGGPNIGYVTNINWIFEDAAKFFLGSVTDFGGSLQIGNTTDLTAHAAAVTANIQLNGLDTRFVIGSQGFLGLGAGIVDKKNVAPNGWLIAPTYNAVAVSLAVDEGIFDHNEIYTGSDINASLLAFGNLSTGFTLSSTSNLATTQFLGGGNMVYATGVTPQNPTVNDVDGVISPTLSVGILASRAVLQDPSKVAPIFPTTPALAFNYLKANNYAAQNIKFAEINRSALNQVTAGYIYTSAAAVPTIARPLVPGMVNVDGSWTDPSRSLEIGACGIAISATLIPAFYGVRV